MKSGFARTKITPPLGVAMIGYYEERYVKGVLDDLYAAAISFDDGESRAVIVTLDVCLMSTEQCDHARRMVSERCGIDENGIFINCSHTHTGPVIGAREFAGLKGDPKYDEFFYNKIVETVVESLKDMRESTLSIGGGVAEKISFIRRYRMKNGNVQTNPGVDNPEIDHPLGTPNDRVKVLKVEREGADTVVLVNFGTHADTVGGEYVSGDWPAFVRETVEKTLDGVKCMFILGSQGDVNHINPCPTPGDRKELDYNTFDGVPRGYGHAKHMGRRVAGAVIGIFDKTEPIGNGKISFGSKKIEIPANSDNARLPEAMAIKALYDAGRAHELPYEKMELTTVVAEANRIVGLKDGPASFPFVLSALKIGDAVLAGLPGECFVDIGRAIEENVGGEVFVCCLVNGGDSYFPTSSAYDEGGYEARTSKLKKGGDRILIDGLSELLASIK